MSLIQTYKLFNQINEDCVKSGELVVPMTAEHVDYYDNQMDNMEMDEEDKCEFHNWLLDQK